MTAKPEPNEMAGGTRPTAACFGTNHKSRAGPTRRFIWNFFITHRYATESILPRCRYKIPDA